ncbi:MAG: hypothetical protein KJ852_18045 [Gammaproteobacteria bacterium]|nr:hypothetical protein [Gammaproteobacteria bacterium]MBU0785467.1 hypothetical protein [Gammaproteobacteria bacterium]MBU0813667.1 hypothetical protein [Gammaproteobacteria bacterium]MBU1788861.1 hypothetical protein [Gammaproteobacteria bacterium]
MRAIKEAKKFIKQDPTDPSAEILSKLLSCLKAEMDFPISDIYKLDFDLFNLAMQILDEWRLERYYAGKARIFNLNLPMHEMHLSQ